MRDILSNKLNIIVLMMSGLALIISLFTPAMYQHTQYIKKQVKNVCVDRVCVYRKDYIECVPFNDVYLTSVFTKKSVLPKEADYIVVKVKEKCNSLPYR